jgi:hypothetical protein
VARLLYSDLSGASLDDAKLRNSAFPAGRAAAYLGDFRPPGLAPGQGQQFQELLNKEIRRRTGLSSVQVALSGRAADN